MSEVSQLLLAAAEGHSHAVAELYAVVYDDLRMLAARHLTQERPGQTLQPTALVHEVYLRLLGGKADLGDVPWTSRRHFFSAAAAAMRRILIEAARRKGRQKRGGGAAREPLDPDQVAAPEIAGELLALDEALTAFADAEPQIAELVTLRYFGGLTLKDAAAALGMAPRTADAHWAYARAWLLAEMTRGDQPG